MPRQPSTTPTDAELEILRVLWDRGPRTVRQIYNAIKANRGTGYRPLNRRLANTIGVERSQNLARSPRSGMERSYAETGPKPPTSNGRQTTP